MYEHTIQLLQTHKGQFRQIAEATGLDYDWLHQVARGVINDPGVRKIEKLHDYLSTLPVEAV